MHESVSQPTAAGPPLTLTAYAKRRGVSTVSVSKAVRAGRLVASVGRDSYGRPTILDPDLADREWQANTRARIEYSAPDSPNPAARADAIADAADPAVEPPRTPAVPPPREISEYYAHRAAREASQSRRTAAQAEIAELGVAERRGEVLRVADVRADVMAKLALVKARMLAIPSRMAQEMPDIAARIVPVIEAAINEALEELADTDTEAAL